MELHRGASDDSKEPLRPNQHLEKVRSSGGGGNPRRLDDPGRREHPQTTDHVLNFSVLGGLLTGGACGNPAPQCRELKGLGEMTEGITAAIELVFQLRPENTALHGGKPGFGVDSQN